MSFCGCLDDIVKGCSNNIGGIRRIFVAPFDSVTATEGTGDEEGVITDITLSAVGGGATCSFVEIEFNKNSSNFVEDGQIDLVNGSTLFTVTTSVMVPRREAAKRNSIALMAAGQQELVLIIEDANGLFWYQGWKNGANLTGIGEGSGTAKADGSKYALTFLSEEDEQMPEVDPTVVANL